MEKCKYCYLRNAKPCYECSACIRGDDHFRPAPKDCPETLEKVINAVEVEGDSE